MFGFAAKLHDFNYAINSVDFSFFPPKDLKERSRKAKSDFIFRKMNEVVKSKLYVRAEIWFWASKRVFSGKTAEDFCPQDDFKNAMTISALDNPENYLMIPFFELPQEQRLYSEMPRVIKYGRRIEINQPILYPIFTEEVFYDQNPGWRQWAQKEYGSTWNKLLEINSSTGPDYAL